MAGKQSYNKMAEKLQGILQEYGDITWRVMDETRAMDEFGDNTVFVIQAKYGRLKKQLILPVYVWEFSEDFAAQAVQFQAERELEE